MTKSSLFNIINFTSIQGGMNRSGFAIVLDSNFAAAVSKIKRDEGERVSEMMLHILTETLGKSNVDPNAIEFVGDSWLLQSLRVGGNCACFSAGSLSPGDFSRHIRYSPHNIDNPRQAMCLLAMWLEWFNTVITLTDYELPFVI